MRDNPNSAPDRRWYTGGKAPKAAPTTAPEGPVTDLGTDGPGYYQTRGIGNKTGRVSPRQQVRASARDLTLAKHGLIDQGAADPNQGQLFDPGPRRTDEQVISDENLNMPTRISAGKQDLQYGAARGFMPNLNAKQKVSAINSVQEGRAKSGTDRGTGNVSNEVMQDRQAAADRSSNVPWYSGVDSSGEHNLRVPGQAAKAIDDRAHRTGSSPAAMARAAAITSPQSAWDMNKEGSPDYRMPNLDHATGVVTAVNLAKDYVSKDDAVQIGSEIQTRDGGLPTMGAKAAGQHYEHGDDVRSPLGIKNAKSQKAPNFEASLRLSDPNKAVQRMASQSYTVDRHDAKAAGVGGSKVLEDRVGVYDHLAMTGTRSAHKNRELAPNWQARTWVGQRGHNQAEGEHQGMLQTGVRAGKVAPQPHLTAASRPANSRALKRQSTAERMGLEF